MQERLTLLASWPKTMISLDELSRLLHKKGQSYEELSMIILELENEHLLEPVKVAGRTTRFPSVAYRYRIMKAAIKEDFQSTLHTYNQQFHSAIRLDRYYTLPSVDFKRDLPFLIMVDTFIKENDFPVDPVPAPERSAELVGNEKWIDEQGGKELLERVQLWKRMQIIPVSDPLMMAVNAKQLHSSQQFHLIVENKTTYQALLPVLCDTVFSTLIYGSGNKIIKSIEQFGWQLPIENATHTFYYFGDIDRAGMSIWHLLNEKRRVELATPFYEACIKKEPFKGKTNQRKDIVAMQAFTAQIRDGATIEARINDGLYYPQEILTSIELGVIWREWSWSFSNGKA